MLKGNRGEWSEVYAFLRILADGEIKPADAKLNEISDEPPIPVVRIVREEKNAPCMSYYVGDPVMIKLDDNTEIAEIDRLAIGAEAENLYREIVSADHVKGSFAVPLTEAFMDKLRLHALKAPSEDKSDITLQIHDARTGFSPICGWSIKSELGHPPTLLNAGASTNFIFELKGCDCKLAMHANEIKSRNKLKDRLSLLASKCDLVFTGVAHKTFERNLRLIDSGFQKS